MTPARKTFISILSVSAVLLLCAGVRTALHSSLFVVQVVEVLDQPATEGASKAPVDAQEIMQLAAVPVGKVSLFDLNLNAIEKRILTQPWIREVRLQKRFPQTLSISVVYRQPRALFQQKQGGLSYVDAEGTVFGRVNLGLDSDLPVLSGIANDHSRETTQKAIRLIDEWDHYFQAQHADLASVSWDHERGFRALATYPLASEGKGRVMIDFGQEIDGAGADLQFRRLSSVLRYLSDKSILSQQIWADTGKKIVVRTTHGS